MDCLLIKYSMLLANFLYSGNMENAKTVTQVRMMLLLDDNQQTINN